MFCCCGIIILINGKKRKTHNKTMWQINEWREIYTVNPHFHLFFVPKRIYTLSLTQ